jgi:hypothetical protein
MYDSEGLGRRANKPKISKTRKAITFPIFEKMISSTDDGYWKNFLSRAARGNFAENFSYNNLKLYYSPKPKYSFCVELNENDMCESFKALRTFCNNNGTVSKIDISEMSNRKASEIASINDWKDVERKTQTNLIYDFVEKCKEKYNLNMAEKKQLESLINIGISGGYINEKNIVVIDSVIVDIENISWNSVIRGFLMDTTNTKIKKIKVSQKGEISDNTSTCLSQNTVKVIDIEKSWAKLLCGICKIGKDVKISISS